MDVTVSLPLLLTVIAYAVGVTGFVVRIGMQAARTTEHATHIGNLLTFMNQYRGTIDRLANLQDRHDQDDKLSFQKIWTKFDDDLTPLIASVRQLEKELERLARRQGVAE